MGIVLTNNAKFIPYTFDQMIKPLAMYTEQYNKVEEELNELGSAADLYRQAAISNPDSELVQAYNKYTTDLDAVTSELSSNGLTPGTRQKLMQLKRRANTEVLPLSIAYKNKQEAMKQYAEDYRKNPRLISEDPSTISLDEYKDGPVPYISYSGEDVYKDAATMAAASSSRVYDYAKDAIFNYSRQGYSPSQINEFFENQDAIPELRDNIAKIKESYNYNNLSRANQSKVDQEILRGIFDGAGYKEDRTKITTSTGGINWNKAYTDKDGNKWVKLHDKFWISDKGEQLTTTEFNIRHGITNPTAPIKVRNRSTGLDVDVSKWNKDSLPNYYIPAEGTPEAYKEDVDNREDWEEIKSSPTVSPISTKKIKDNILEQIPEDYRNYYQYFEVKDEDGEVIGYRAIPLSKPPTTTQEEDSAQETVEEPKDKKANKFKRK